MADLSFLVKEKLHTGFGEEIKNASSYDDVLKQAGLNWTVGTHDAYAQMGDKMVVVPGAQVVVRNEDEKPLGIVSDKYKLVNNEDAFAFTESLFNSKDIEFIRGGSYRGGACTWLESKVTGQYSILGDDVDCYLIFMNSHDGSGSVKTFIVPERIACSNALNFPLREAPRFWRCIHTGDPMKKIDEAKQILLAGSSYMNALEARVEMLNKINISLQQVDNLIKILFPITDDLSDRQKDNRMIKRNELMSVYLNKDDLDDISETGYRFISAVADYADHRDGKKTKNAAINRWVDTINGNPLVDRAYDLILTI